MFHGLNKGLALSIRSSAQIALTNLLCEISNELETSLFEALQTVI